MRLFSVYELVKLLSDFENKYIGTDGSIFGLFHLQKDSLKLPEHRISFWNCHCEYNFIEVGAVR